MKVKLILPSLTEAKSVFWRPIKYSLFPPLGLATLAAYLDETDEIDLQDQHVEKLNLNDDPDLVIIQVYITNAKRAYAIAKQYREFYKWKNVFKASFAHESFKHKMKHLVYTGGWKKFENLWNVLINMGSLKGMLPLLELLLCEVKQSKPQKQTAEYPDTYYS